MTKDRKNNGQRREEASVKPIKAVNESHLGLSAQSEIYHNSISENTNKYLSLIHI